MSSHHAVVFVSHGNAQVLEFGAEHREGHQLRSHSHPTAQHGSEVRAEHEFFAQVCDAIDAVAEALVVGSRHGISDFERYVAKHRPATAPRIVGYDVVDHPSENQLVALGREFFLQRARGDAAPAR
jgi:hypothetical protein